jgi:hypothetical protein
MCRRATPTPAPPLVSLHPQDGHRGLAEPDRLIGNHAAGRHLTSNDAVEFFSIDPFLIVHRLKESEGALIRSDGADQPFDIAAISLGVFDRDPHGSVVHGKQRDPASFVIDV